MSCIRYFKSILYIFQSKINFIIYLTFLNPFCFRGPTDIITTVSKVLLAGFSKLVGKDSNEPNDVQNAAYSALAQLSRTCPTSVNQDLKIVLSYFNHLTNSPPELHTSIREALVAMAPAFAWKAKDDEDVSGEIQLTGQQHLLLAMLSDNAESKLHIVQNVTSIFLTTCYPEYFAPARYLLLLIAGERYDIERDPWILKHNFFCFNFLVILCVKMLLPICMVFPKRII